MKKLLLTSAGFLNPKTGQKFLELVGKPAEQIKIIFVPTASRIEHELKYVRISKKELFDLGIKRENFKVLDITRKIPYSEVSNFDAMYVCGGNTFYLLAKVREYGFDKVIKQFVEEGKVYVGVSAGSILVGPTVDVSSPWDEDDVGLTDFTGLNLVNVATIPHYQRKEKSIVEDLREKLKCEIVTLTDNQALLVLGEKTQVIE
jgi:peptidase E